MGTKIDSTVAPVQHGDAMGVQGIIEEKYAWQDERGAQFNPTIDILRYDETGGIPYAHVAPTQTQVTSVDGVSLSSVPCTVEESTVRIADRFGVKAVEDGDKVFVVYDVRVQVQDRIEWAYSSDLTYLYEPQMVRWEAESGRCEVYARLVVKE